MGAEYRAKGDQGLITTLTTALTVGSNATTAQRNYITEFILFIALTPSDSTITWNIQRCTALGTGSAVTPMAGDAADRVAQAAVAKNHTAEPTMSANNFIWESVGVYARATVRIVSPPNKPLMHAATVGAGIAWQALHASRTEDFGVVAVWEE